MFNVNSLLLMMHLYQITESQESKEGLCSLVPLLTIEYMKADMEKIYLIIIEKVSRLV